MFMKMRGKKGFTLIELMVVAVIVAILAAVLIPLMTGNRARAYSTEAEAALGTIRNSLRVYYAEHNNNYPVIVAGTDVVGNVDGISDGDLDGTFFSDEAYTITSAAASYDILCTWNDSVAPAAPRAADVNTTGYTTSLDETGTFTRTGY